ITVSTETEKTTWAKWAKPDSLTGQSNPAEEPEILFSARQMS
ncbi:hypothetical protein A2U01_0094930, partial [Trifolium medium]|nr:hypothetical protein [Trifolium medium]